MKKQILTLLALILAFAASAQNLRETVAIVRPKLSETTQTFLADFSKSLRGDGFHAAADVLQNYGKGSFGTGFAYRDKHNNRLYIITNRHVVEQADRVDIEFSLPDNSTKRFDACPVVGVHDDFDLAFIALPEGANVPALETTDQSITDGTTVFTAGFPALEDRPSWQFGQGIVSNANALIKSLTNSKELPLIQHTAQVDAGSSGGPLLIRDEQAATGYAVIGINTWKAAGRENKVRPHLPRTLRQGAGRSLSRLRPDRHRLRIRRRCRGSLQVRVSKLRIHQPGLSGQEDETV